MQTESIKRSESASSSNDPRTYLLSSMGLGVMWGWTYLYCLLFATGSRESDLLPSALALGWKIATIAILGISVFWKPPTNKHERELRTSAVTSSMIGGSAVVLWYVGKTTLCIPIEACAAVLFGLSYGMFYARGPSPCHAALSHFCFLILAVPALLPAVFIFFSRIRLVGYASVSLRYYPPAPGCFSLHSGLITPIHPSQAQREEPRSSLSPEPFV